MPSPLRDSRGRPLPIVETVTSTASSTSSSTYYDRFRPQASSPKTEAETYYHRYRPHSQSPLTDTNVTRMSPGSINNDPLPPSQCPSRLESIATTSTSLLYGMRLVPPAEPSSSREGAASSAFPPKKAVDEWEERKRLARAAISTPNFTTPSMATARVPEKATPETSDKSPAALSHKRHTPVTLERVTPMTSEKCSTASAPKRVPVMPSPAAPSVATAKVAEKFTPKTSDKSSTVSELRKMPVTQEKPSTVKAVLRTPRSIPPELKKSSPLKSVRTAPPPQAPIYVTSQKYTIPVTPPGRSRSPYTATSPSQSLATPVGPRAPPSPAQEAPIDEIHIPHLALWAANMSPKTYRNRMESKREREKRLPPSPSPPKNARSPRFLDLVVGASKVTQEERKWKQRDLGRKIEGLEEEVEKLEKKKEQAGQKREKIGEDLEAERERRRFGAW